MRIRQLAIVSTFALLTSAFTAPVLAARPGAAMQPAFQGGAQSGRSDKVSDDRGRDPRERELYDRYTGRDVQWQLAFKDGYNAGLRDGRSNRRSNPTIDSLFRAGDHGYRRNWGPRDQYVSRYRSAFRDGYERGYFDSTHHRGVLSLFFRWGR